MVRQKSIVKDYSAIYSLLKIEDTPLLITFFRDSNSVDLQVMFFTYNVHRKIRDYSITLSAFPKSDKLYLVYAIDNYLLYNIFNKVMCEHLIYYMYLETDKARQSINEVLEDYKDE
jgi:hypothetical protein